MNPSFSVTAYTVQNAADSRPRTKDEAFGPLEYELAIATMEGDTTLVTALIRQGASVNAKNRSGFTALMIAASGGYTEVCRRLLVAGAEIAAEDDSRRTALDWAIIKSHDSIAKLLSAHLRRLLESQ